MDNLPTFLMDMSGSFATLLSENPILFVACIAISAAIWRFSGTPSDQK
ncbi:hypothetical protein HKCCE4037_09270 [Rhodobacterales bacterium HKCCE4037]|nr:hypothetical protein [Rhodobacterales bacterium HKCCE4037]